MQLQPVRNQLMVPTLQIINTKNETHSKHSVNPVLF